MSDIQLLATDLDGTLIGPVSEFHLYADFNDVVGELRAESDTKWAICTGRSLSSFREFFAPMRMMGVAPDYMIVNHAYIYSRTRKGYVPHLFWNVRIRYLLWKNRLNVKDAIGEWHRMITGASLGVTTVSKTDNRLCLSFDSDESAIAAANVLKEKIKAFQHLRLFRYLREVDIRAVPYTKGLAISELCRHIGVDAKHVLAIGDGHNDISMFEDDVAGMIGCPANAEAEVIETINETGGHISGKKSLSGVLDIIKAYRTNSVCSDFPEGWVPPAESKSPIPRKKKRGEHEGGWKQMIKVVFLVSGTLYALLLAFATFRLLPGPLNGLVSKPFRFLMTRVFRFFESMGLF